MIAHIHSIGIHNTIPAGEQPDLATELRRISGKVYRRTDHFIQLTVIGAHKAVKGVDLPSRTAIYMTSGQGNISVFDRICAAHHKQQLPKPVDFINLLSNSAGFYVASHLGLNGKNLFLSHHRFPIQMTLLAALNDVRLGNQQAVLIGGVDEWFPKQHFARKLLGINKATKLGEGSNWLLIKPEAAGAIGTLELTTQALDSSQLHSLLATADTGTWLAFSRHCPAVRITEILNKHANCRRYCYEYSCGYYETLPLYALNHFLSRKEGRLIHIDANGGQYVVMKVNITSNRSSNMLES